MNLPSLKPGPRAGTLQSQRGLKALSSRWFAIEERSSKDWLVYLRRFSQWLKFLGGDQQLPRDWSQFFPDEGVFDQLLLWLDEGEAAADRVSPEVKELAARPDMALLLSFLRVMRHPQAQFRDLTERHLSYYYRDILGIEERQAEPDQLHMVVSLAQEADPLVLPEGTLFDAGTDIDGAPRYYRLNEPAGVNHGRIHTVRSLSSQSSASSRDLGFVKTLLIDGDLGLEFPPAGSLTFGEPRLLDSERQQRPETGWILASPLLWLSEGRREITLSFDRDFVRSLQTQLLTENLSDYFDVSISTAEGMLPLNDPLLSSIEQNGDSEQLNWVITLESLFPAVEPPPVSAHDQLLTPYLQFNVKTGQDDRLIQYKSLNQLLLNQVTLTTAVSGLKHLKIRNDLSQLDPTGPFEPFGSQPKKGSRLQFTHTELALKPLDSIEVTMDWNGLPENLDSYYQPYEQYLQSKPGQASLQWPRHSIRFESPFGESEETSLFGSPIKRTTLIDDSADPQQSLGSLYPEGMEWSGHGSLPVQVPEPRKWPFWYSLTLTGDDFGHSLYSRVSSWHNNRYFNGSTSVLTEVNTPWTPLVNQLTLDYTARQVIDVQQAGIGQLHQILHVHPMGTQAVVDAEKQTLLPALRQSGYLYIGIQATPLQGSIDLLFQLSPVDSDPKLAAATVQWSYLENNRWLPFGTNNQDESVDRALILADDTNGMVDSGIIRFGLNPAMTRTDGFPGKQQLWLRASINTNINEDIELNWSRLLGVHSQAMVAHFDDSETVPQHLPVPLPAETVTGLLETSLTPELYAAVDSVIQPYASFAGRPAEAPDFFNLRVSERLRHRGRALTIWDYEHLVLDQFPDIVLAHCQRDPDQVNGVRLMVVPAVNDPAMLKPRVQRNVQQQINNYLRPLMPPAARLKVVSPAYQEVRFDISLTFHPEYDAGLILQTLNDELVTLLSPWASLKAGDEPQPDIHVSDIVAFVVERPYVDLVLRVNVDTLLPADDGGPAVWIQVKGDVIRPARNDIILVPSARHSLRALPLGSTVFDGISLMQIDYDFTVEQPVILEGVGMMTIAPGNDELIPFKITA